MASLSNLLSGRIGNLIFYERNGKTCIRSRAKRVRQTKATKSSAALFGKVATINKALRSGLDKILPESKERAIMLRLNQQLLPLLKHTELKGFSETLPEIDQFQFNEATDITARLNIPFNVDWKKKQAIQLNFSHANLFKAIKSPKGTIAIYLELAIAGCKTADATSTANYFTSVKLTAGAPGPATIELPCQLQTGCITIVVAALKYEILKNRIPSIITNKKWLPVGIISACYGKPD